MHTIPKNKCPHVRTRNRGTETLVQWPHPKVLLLHQSLDLRGWARMSGRGSYEERAPMLLICGTINGKNKFLLAHRPSHRPSFCLSSESRPMEQRALLTSPPPPPWLFGLHRVHGKSITFSRIISRQSAGMALLRVLPRRCPNSMQLLRLQPAEKDLSLIMNSRIARVISRVCSLPLSRKSTHPRAVR